MPPLVSTVGGSLKLTVIGTVAPALYAWLAGEEVTPDTVGGTVSTTKLLTDDDQSETLPAESVARADQ